MRDLHIAHMQLLETALVRAEWCLVINSYADIVIRKTGTPYDQLENTLNEAADWIDEGHEPVRLTTVRGWLPYPQWREPTPANLWLKGYPNAPALQPT